MIFAIKERLAEDQTNIENWKEEIRFLEKIEKEIPNLITTRKVCLLDDIYNDKKDKYIVLEWVEGKHFEYLTPKHLNFTSFHSEKDFLRLVIILLNNLLFLHSKNILHRDISPKNIMFTEESNYFNFYLFIYLFILIDRLLFIIIYYFFIIYFYLFLFILFYYLFLNLFYFYLFFLNLFLFYFVLFIFVIFIIFCFIGTKIRS